MIENNLWLSSENDSSSHLENYMCEGVGEDSGTWDKGESHSYPWHVDIQVEICMIYLNVCLVVIA